MADDIPIVTGLSLPLSRVPEVQALDFRQVDYLKVNLAQRSRVEGGVQAVLCSLRYESNTVT